MDRQRRQIVEGISAIAVALAEMGCDAALARADIVAQLRLAGVVDVGILDEAAAALSVTPHHPIGAPGAIKRLNAHLEAREWLELLAADLRASR